MSIPMTCDCGKRFLARDQAAGKKVRCPACGALHMVAQAGGDSSWNDADSPQKKRKHKRGKSVPLYRNLALLIPLGVCVLLLILILGVSPIRNTIFRLGTNVSEDPVGQDNEPIKSANPGSSTQNQEDVDPAVKDEKELGILPPEAAKQPGRKLPKLLLVGPQRNMFPSLEDALAVAVGGDIVEIRTNGPLMMEPGKAIWKGNGTLTIRAGKGFHPMMVRKGKAEGAIVTLAANEQKSKASVLLRDLLFINPMDTAIASFCPLEVRRCFFANTGWAVALRDIELNTPATIDNCYFWGISNQGFMAQITNGKLVLRNNLFVHAGVPLNFGTTGKRDQPSQVTGVFQHNLFIHSQGTFQYGVNSIVESSDNLIAYQRPSYGFEFGGRGAAVENAQPSLTYRGKNNLYFETNWGIWRLQSYGSDQGFAGWQRLTRNGEQRVILDNPLFADPRMVLLAPQRILPPKAFALHPKSPARGAGSDGRDIGAELSLIPTPPRGLEQIVLQALAESQRK